MAGFLGEGVLLFCCYRAQSFSDTPELQLALLMQISCSLMSWSCGSRFTCKSMFSVYISQLKLLSTQFPVIHSEISIIVLRGNKKSTPEHGDRPCGAVVCVFACSGVQ